jgi:hypothetical protein
VRPNINCYVSNESEKQNEAEGGTLMEEKTLTTEVTEEKHDAGSVNMVKAVI